MLTLSNKISLSRIFCIPPLVFCITQVQHNNHYRYICLFIMLIIGLSDALDGYVARKRNEMTNLGRYLDPFADKLVLVISCIILSSDRISMVPTFRNCSRESTGTRAVSPLSTTIALLLI